MSSSQQQDLWTCRPMQHAVDMDMLWGAKLLAVQESPLSSQ